MNDKQLSELETIARRCSFASFPEYESLRFGLLELIADYRLAREHGRLAEEHAQQFHQEANQAERVACEYEKALRFYAENCDVMYSPEPGAPPLEDAWYVAREALRLHGLARREET